MAEIRIPTDCIPTDLLLRLQEISRNVLSPVSNALVSSNKPTPSPFPFGSSLVTSNSPSSVQHCPPSTAGSAHPAALAPSPVPVPPHASPFPLQTCSAALRQQGGVSTTNDLHDLGQNRLPCVDSPSPSPAKNMEGRREGTHHAAPTPLTRSPDRKEGRRYVADEVDGGDGIVHAFSQAPPRLQVTCYDAVDDSDIVRIFPEERTPPKSQSAIGSRYPCDDSDIVRIFPPSTEDVVEKETTSSRRDIVRALSPLTQVTSSLNFQLVDEGHPKQRSPLRAESLLGATPRVHMKTSPPTLSTPKKAKSPGMKAQSSNQNAPCGSSPFKFSQRRSHVHPTTSQTGTQDLNIWSSMTAAGHTNNFNTTTTTTTMNNYNTTTATMNKYNTTFPTNIDTDDTIDSAKDYVINDDLHMERLSPSTQLLPVPNPMMGNVTPVKSSRQGSPIPGNSRLSPVLPTPPETPRASDREDDEVFSYDDVQPVCWDVTATSSNTLSQTPKRDNTHFRVSAERTSGVRGASAKGLSPFSPTHSLAGMHVGDRRHTRKRLSFEDDSTLQGQAVTSEARGYNLEGQAVTSEARGYNLEEVFASPQSLLQSPASSPFKSGPITDQPLLSGSSQFHKATIGALSPFSYGSRPTSPYPIRGNPPQQQQQQQLVQEGDAPIPASSSFQQMSDACGSPERETFSLLSRAWTPQGQGHGQSAFQGSPARLRIHSEGDDVTDGRSWHGRVPGQASEMGVGRPRGMTFPGFGKRRRLERDDDLGNMSCMPTGSGVDPIHPPIHNPPSPSLPSSSSASSSSSSLSSVAFAFESSTISTTASSFQPAFSRPSKAIYPPEEETAETSACSCAKMEMNLLHFAAKAYGRIRSSDAVPQDFEHFREELVKTNTMLRESMTVVKTMKSMCSCQHKHLP